MTRNTHTHTHEPLWDGLGKFGAEAWNGEEKKDDTLDEDRCYRRPPLREPDKERECVGVNVNILWWGGKDEALGEHRCDCRPQLKKDVCAVKTTTIADLQ